ncbi:hypothetical protein IQ07DRAFT_583936 [Pyrenochaeta sp. DS3sAY3a]|nr:hypothetical protein IQ07DRAFT_583936 [Pyrenochaeta sp. DS3sAY3a]
MPVNKNRFAALSDDPPETKFEQSHPSLKSTKHLPATQPETQQHGSLSKEQGESAKGHADTNVTDLLVDDDIDGGEWEIIKSRKKTKTEDAGLKKDTNRVTTPSITVTPVSDSPPTDDFVSTDQDGGNPGSTLKVEPAQEKEDLESDVCHMHQDQETHKDGQNAFVLIESDTASTEDTSSTTKQCTQDLAQDPKEAVTPPGQQPVDTTHNGPDLFEPKSASASRVGKDDIERSINTAEPCDEEDTSMEARSTTSTKEAEVTAQDSSPSTSENEVADAKEAAATTAGEPGATKRKNRKRGKKGGSKRRKTALHADAVTVGSPDQPPRPRLEQQEDPKFGAEDVVAVERARRLAQAKHYA